MTQFIGFSKPNGPWEPIDWSQLSKLDGSVRFEEPGIYNSLDPMEYCKGTAPDTWHVRPAHQSNEHQP